MTYAIDFVLDVVRKISSKEPVLFQKVGSLYVASTEGFGKVKYGLRTTPEEIQTWEKRRQSPEIVESQDAIEKWVGDSWNKEPKFLNGEQKYFKDIVFGPDSNSFSLEEITKTAQELANCLMMEKFAWFFIVAIIIVTNMVMLQMVLMSGFNKQG